ncbi:DUF5776 domain-containing protein [Secundilactobacillus folii]|uniref:DUF5776 domain-containing protein n=1 Tax=Secundilactobacillus folii TaxID=2678357 RepID=A0A7X2XX85_9LACO|nr:DUF5776 domain-containing protein [Secundilactobacillus folii]MTV83268.1 hypothetical protein [Secundilactobacillus folii]
MKNKRKYFGVVLTAGAAALALGISSGAITPTIHAASGLTITAKAATYSSQGYWDAVYRLGDQSKLWPNNTSDYYGATVDSGSGYNHGIYFTSLRNGTNFGLTIHQPYASKVGSNNVFSFTSAGSGATTGSDEAPSAFNQQWNSIANQAAFFKNWNESMNSADSGDSSLTSLPNIEIPPLVISGGVLDVDANGNVLNTPATITPSAVEPYLLGWTATSNWPVSISSGSNVNGAAIGFTTDSNGDMHLSSANATKWVQVSSGAHFLFAKADANVKTSASTTAKETFYLVYAINRDATSDFTVRNSTVAEGSTWNPADNFVSGTNQYGTALKFSDLKTTGSVDTSTPGTYNVTYTYPAPGKDVTKTATITVTGNNGGSTTTGGNSSSSSSNSSTSSTTNNNTSSGTSTDVSTGTAVAPKNSVIYATKGIYLYSKPTFTKSARKVHYPKQTRSNRPMFIVRGTARSKNGVLRYSVKNTETGKTGYITANKNYVQNVYYKTVPKDKTITVWYKGGLNAYKKSNLTGKVRHYKKGAHVKVTRLVKYHLTTRYVLSNGTYVSSNKRLVYAGRH